MSKQEIVNIIKNYCFRNDVSVIHSDIDLYSTLEYFETYYNSETIIIIIDIINNKLCDITTASESMEEFEYDTLNIIKISELIKEERVSKINELLYG
jgi:hypothetical protein